MMKSSRNQIFLGAILTLIIAVLYLFVYINGISYQNTFNDEAQANITVIPDSNLPTLDFSLLSSVTPTATVDPNITNSDGIRIGAFVQIHGTGGSGLNVRREPGTGSKAIFLGADAEVFEVIGGPTGKDGYVWWLLSAPYDQTRQGWAAEDYLHIIEP
jgi:hypothetical protein